MTTTINTAALERIAEFRRQAALARDALLGMAAHCPFCESGCDECRGLMAAQRQVDAAELRSWMLTIDRHLDLAKSITNG